MKKPFLILLHLGYWLIYLLLLLVIFSIISLQTRKTASLSTALWPLLVLSLIPNLFSFYSAYFLVFREFLRNKKLVFPSILVVFMGLISAFAAFAVSLFMFGLNQPILTDANEFLSLFISFFLIAVIHGGIALIIRGFVAWFEEIKLKEELAHRNYETEIALVKSQINPHFLFNTINNIDVLIAKDAMKASRYLNQLSDIMRYMVYEAKSEKIPLTKELEYLEKYLGLQKIRTVNPNYVNFTIVGEAKNRQIAPMIFFPFIENAFKHTENNKKFNTINLKISLTDTAINFQCRNTYQKSPGREQNYGGLGNKLIQKRLDLLYPQKHGLEIEDHDGIYQVKLAIYED